MEVMDVFPSSINETNVVLLKNSSSEILLPIWIGNNEAYAMSLRLSRQRAPRPITYDLFDNVLKKLNTEIKEIFIEDIRDAVFLGQITLKQGNSTFTLDARPSDSIVMALGSNAPIYVSDKVLKKAGITVDELKEKILDNDSEEKDSSKKEPNKKPTPLDKGDTL